VIAVSPANPNRNLKYDLGLLKFYLTDTLNNTWNSSPSYAVSANTIDCFKSRLDKYWPDQDTVYDFRAEIQGAGVN